MTWLRDAAPTGCPKIDRLAALQLRLDQPSVAPGLVVRLGDPAPALLDALLERAPLIVRGAWPGEDGDTSSLAGHSQSVHDCTTRAQVEHALATVAVHAPTGSHALIQEQLAGDVVVVLVETNGVTWTERYPGGPDALAGTASPSESGPLATHPDRPAIEAVLGALGEHELGWDLELVDTPAGLRPVQARPLTRPILPGIEEFLREAEGPLPEGDYRLDGEHNPAPLSPAHAWLIQRLAEARPRSGGLRVIAGWLYARVLVRDLGHPNAAADGRPDPALEFARLRDVHLPRALARWQARERQARAVTRVEDLSVLLDAAWEDFLAMIDVYLAHYAGRPRAAAGPSLATLLGEPALPLPDRWDLCAPALGTPPPESISIRTPEDFDAAIGEVDDVLFALGLAPVACAFRRAGQLHGLGEDGFLLRGDELVQPPPGSDLARRRLAWDRQMALRPPRRILERQPVPERPAGRLAGYGIGPSVQGPLVIRSSLADLLEWPPTEPSIVALPALTAPAARVLASLDPRPLGICTEFGGQASHAAIMCRELGLPALIGCRGCTELHAGRIVILQTVLGRLVVGRPDGLGSIDATIGTD